jgi:hypothetical protein
LLVIVLISGDLSIVLRNKSTPMLNRITSADGFAGEGHKKKTRSGASITFIGGVEYDL